MVLQYRREDGELLAKGIKLVGYRTTKDVKPDQVPPPSKVMRKIRRPRLYHTKSLFSRQNSWGPGVTKLGAIDPRPRVWTTKTSRPSRPRKGRIAEAAEAMPRSANASHYFYRMRMMPGLLYLSNSSRLPSWAREGVKGVLLSQSITDLKPPLQIHGL